MGKTKFMEFWVMDKNGLPMFHIKGKDVESVDKNMVAGFLSAFQAMLAVSAQEKLETIKFRNSNIFIYPAPNPAQFYSVGRCPKKTKEKEIRQILAKLTQQFIDNYWILFFDGWVGDTTLFEGFKENIKDFIQSS